MIIYDSAKKNNATVECLYGNDAAKQLGNFYERAA